MGGRINREKFQSHVTIFKFVKVVWFWRFEILWQASKGHQKASRWENSNSSSADRTFFCWFKQKVTGTEYYCSSVLEQKLDFQLNPLWVNWALTFTELLLTCMPSDSTLVFTSSEICNNSWLLAKLKCNQHKTMVPKLWVNPKDSKSQCWISAAL